VFELAHELNIPVKRGDLTRYDLLTADEAFFTGNSICILPVSSVDGAPMANGAPGPITRKLMDLWARQVKCDWAEKAVNSLC
jgi:branched-chain amino acid aminotransferase